MATLPAIQPLRVPDPLQGYAVVQNILASQQQQQVNALAMEKARRDAEREAALANYLKSANLTTPEGVAGLTRFGKPGLEYQTALGQAETARLTRAKTQADLITSKLTQGRQVFAMAPTPAALADAAKAQFSDPVLGPVLTRMNLTPDSLAAYIAQKSATPEGFAQVKLEFASTADQMVDQLKSQLERFERGRLLGDETAPATAPVVAPAAGAAAPVAAAPQELSALAVEQAAQPRPASYAQGQFVGGAPTAVTFPVGEYPAEPAPRNLLAPTAAAPVSALVTPPTAPGVQVAGPAALPDTDARIADLRQRLRRATIAGNKAAVDVLKGELEDLTKVKTGGPEIFQLQERLDKLPPGSPRRAEIEARIKRLTEEQKGTKVEIKLPAQEQEFEKALGAGQAKKILEDKNIAEDARSIIDTVQQGRQLLRSGMITGFGAEALTQIGAALNQAGISFASDSVANTQAFAANMAQNVGRIIKQFGAGTGLSNADREYAEKMAGGKITLDRAAIERILDINERAARNVITAHNKRVEGVKTNVPLTVELPPAMPTAPAAAPAGRPSLEQIFQPPKR